MPAYGVLVDPVELYLAAGITVVLIGFGYLGVRFSGIRAQFASEGRKILVDLLFMDAVDKGKQVKIPRPEVVQMASSYVQAALPVIIPQVLEWAKTNIKLGQTGAGGPGGMGMDPLLAMVPKEYRGLAGIALRLFGGKLGLGGAGASQSSSSSGGLSKTL